jgi:asparagine synthetase B (glutamine-hydrolysing)
VYGPRLHAVMATMEGIVGPARENGAGGCAVAAAMRRDQEVWLPDDVPMKADRASMQVSLELRTPYLERDLAAFAHSVPIDVHRRGGGKYLLRKTLAQLMPGAVSRRRKVAFRTPTADWLRGPLKPLVEEPFSTAHSPVRAGSTWRRSPGWHGGTRMGGRTTPVSSGPP